LKGERLREKLGATPPFGGERDPRADHGRGEGPEPNPPAEDEMQLANTVVDPFPLDGSEPAVRAPDHDPTVELTDGSIPAYPELASDRPPVGEDVRNRTTNTTPIGLLRPTELTPEPHSLPDVRRPPLWSRAGFRRSAVTLGLGAAIGIPPAIVGVVYRAHRHTDAPLSAVAPAEPAVAPTVASPLAVTPGESAELVERPDLLRVSAPSAEPSAFPAPALSAIRPARTYRPARAPSRGEAASRPSDDTARQTSVLDTPSFPLAGAAPGPAIEPPAIRSAAPVPPPSHSITLPPSGL